MVTRNNEIIALLKPALDVHTLGINAIEDFLINCGFIVQRGPLEINESLHFLQHEKKGQELARWLVKERITRLGISYRLDPDEAFRIMGYLIKLLLDHNLLFTQGGRIRALYFAGLPKVCNQLETEYKGLVTTFSGGENYSELIQKMQLTPKLLPDEMQISSSYDEMRLELGQKIIENQEFLKFKPLERPFYQDYGTAKDTICQRLAARKNKFYPLIRAHAGPYNQDLSREKAITEYCLWAKELAQSGYLDILSIGSSQLTQSNFGEDWQDRANGGGVPINSQQEYRAIWKSATPMLVRTYAGTKNIPQLAKIYEDSINIAWHALSMWWFNQLDGRGPYDLYKSLTQQQEALSFIALSQKPFEPNLAHHFAFRGGDDVSCLLALWLSVKLAKKRGVKVLILQLMLNTPRCLGGVNDLIKARAALSLLGELRDHSFKIIIQPRAGIDYFNVETTKAKMQLAAVTALMDDIEAADFSSPPLIHVVSYSEASHLATPPIINESIQITQQTLLNYRQLKQQHQVETIEQSGFMLEKQNELIAEVKTLIKIIEKYISDPYSAEGFYQIFAAGFIACPDLWHCRDEFKHAVQLKTKFLRGSVQLVDENNKPLNALKRGEAALKNLNYAQNYLKQRQQQ